MHFRCTKFTIRNILPKKLWLDYCIKCQDPPAFPRFFESSLLRHWHNYRHVSIIVTRSIGSWLASQALWEARLPWIIPFFHSWFPPSTRILDGVISSSGAACVRPLPGEALIFSTMYLTAMIPCQSSFKYYFYRQAIHLLSLCNSHTRNSFAMTMKIAFEGRRRRIGTPPDLL